MRGAGLVEGDLGAGAGFDDHFTGLIGEDTGTAQVMGESLFFYTSSAMDGKAREQENW